jgi:hypothetical protein
MARLFSSLCLMAMPTSSSKRWREDMGSPWPTPEERLQPWRALPPATACPLDGDDPLGTAKGGMVVQDAHARLLMTHAAQSEHGEEARQGLDK